MSQTGCNFPSLFLFLLLLLLRPLPSATSTILIGIQDGSTMLQCDTCQEWFHGRCVGLRERQINAMEGEWMCKECANRMYRDHFTQRAYIRRKA